MKWFRKLLYAHDYKMIHPGLRRDRMKVLNRVMIIHAVKAYIIWIGFSWELVSIKILEKKKPYVAAQGNPSKTATTIKSSLLKNRTYIYDIKSTRKNK